MGLKIGAGKSLPSIKSVLLSDESSSIVAEVGKNNILIGFMVKRPKKKDFYIPIERGNFQSAWNKAVQITKSK